MPSKPILVIAGPGAGKTYGMVNEIINSLKMLSPAKYMVVITYTNSATKNIKERLSKQIQIPPNLFIGTMHSFLNKFIVIPFSSFHNNVIKGEKLFIQCQTSDIFEKIRKEKKKTYSPKDAAIMKSKIKDFMNKKGYITYDQTVSLAKQCIENRRIKKIIANRIQFLYVDEFQDTGNNIFSVIDAIRKEKVTEIYCVGDPEQYIQSFNSSIRTFKNIPILKTSNTQSYELRINGSNFRSTETITNFLNYFNGRVFGTDTFNQSCKTGNVGEPVKFIYKSENVSDMIPLFFDECQKLNIANNDRCILAKRNEVINRIKSALNDNIISPRKTNNFNPIKEIMTTLLSVINLNQTEYLKKYNATIFDLRKTCIHILKEIKSGKIQNENTFFNFIKDELKLEIKSIVPVKLKNLRINDSILSREEAVMLSNIHNYKGLESEAVLAIAKTEAELLLWLEMDRTIRDTKRTNETTDYPRLGYVAFSRAKQLLCIACLEPISVQTKGMITALNVEIVN